MKQISLSTVLKLRVQLWWMFFLDPTSNYRLTVRWAKRFTSPIDGHGFAGYWAWVCVVDLGPIDLQTSAKVRRKKIVQEYALGPIRQWTLQEALNLAARKAAWVLHPDQEPVREPKPNEPAPKHGKMYRLLDEGKIGVECSCGYVGTFPRCHPEQDAPTRCKSCALAERAYELHLKYAEEQEAVSR